MYYLLSLVFFTVKNKIIYRRNHLIVIQKMARMYIAKKQHQPRIKGVVKIRNLTSQLSRMEEISKQLKSAKEKSISDIKKLQTELEAAMQKIKVIEF